MASKKTVFRDEWLDFEKYPLHKEWLVKIDKHSFQCSVCTGATCRPKIIKMSNMGYRALKSHYEHPTHKANLRDKQKNQQPRMSSYLKHKETSNPPVDGHSSVTVTESVSQSETVETGETEDGSRSLGSGKVKMLDAFVSRDAVTRAEVIWAMNMVENHLSYNSCKVIGQTFEAMFPDSDIAKKFQLGKSKVAYLIPFGLSPYFSKRNLEKLAKSEKLVTCFDEAFNRISKKSQMDICVRFWDEDLNQVQAVYWNSAFLGHQTADDLLEKYEEATINIPQKKVIQISMDGPNVNWSFLQKYKEKYEDEVEDPKLLQIGSCGLHVIHGAFKCGQKASGWNLDIILRSAWNLFKESPARSADFVRITGCDLFPLKFCGHHWLENAVAIDRLLKILLHLQTYVKNVTPKPKVCSFEQLEQACADKFLESKLEFCRSVACCMEPFLKKYQSQKPLAPFLYHDLLLMLSELAKRFIKPEEIPENITGNHLLKLLQSENLEEKMRNAVDVVIGNGAKLKLPMGVSQIRLRAFYSSAKDFLKACSLKIIEKSPLKYKLTRLISCLVPHSIVDFKDSMKKKFELLLLSLLRAKLLDAPETDCAQGQFAQLTATNSKFIAPLKSFSSDAQRLDTFYHELLGNSPGFFELMKVIKLVLILSHGNAGIESGFSVNEDILVENMKEKSLIGQRIVYDHIQLANGHLNVEISRNLLIECRTAHGMYKSHLEAERKKNAEKARSAEEQKTKYMKEIKEIEAQKKRHIEEHEALKSQLNELKKKMRKVK